MALPTSVLAAVADEDRDVAVALDDAVAAALGSGMEPLEARRLADVDDLDLERVDVRVVVVLGVGDRRLEHLADELRALLRREAQRRQGLPDRLAADHVRDETALLRRDARVLELGCD